jgi:hypothetical protein
MRYLWYILYALLALWAIAVVAVSDGLSHCADGWISPSFGQGRCSWHGGATTQREVKEVSTVFSIALGLWAVAAFWVSTKESSRKKLERERAIEAARAERDRTHPLCPNCQIHMIRRRAKRGAHKGQGFWGCNNYPRCKALVQIGEEQLYLKREK